MTLFSGGYDSTGYIALFSGGYDSTGYIFRKV